MSWVHTGYLLALPPRCMPTVLLLHQCITYVCGHSVLPTRLHMRQHTLLCSVTKREAYMFVLLVPCLLGLSLLVVSRGVRLQCVD